MTLEELREACAKVAWARLFDVLKDDVLAQDVEAAIRAIPLPAPVDDEFAGHTPGPWVFDGTNITTTAGRFVGAAPEERRPTGLLMAAAPRLLRERDEARDELARATKERDAITRISQDAWSALGGSVTPLERLPDAIARVLSELRAEVAALTKERDEARAALAEYEREAECQVDGIPLCHGPGKQDYEWCRACLLAFYRQSRAELAGLTAALAAAQRERDEARVELVEANERIDAFEEGTA